MTISDREVLELLATKPELLAIADALHGADARLETAEVRLERLPRPRRRRRGLVRASALAVAAAAVLALLLASPWNGGGGASLVDRALAAVGNRPVLHALLRYSVGTRIDLRTGHSAPIVHDAEVWYDAQRQIVRSVLTVDGRVVSRLTGRGSLGLENPALIATLYRRALKQGKVHKTGQGVVRGHRVIIIASSAHGSTMRAALDAKTFQLMRLQLFELGRLASQLDVLRMETLTRAQADLPRTAPELITTGGGSASVRTAPGAKLPKTFTRPGLWVGPSINGRKLSSVLVWQESSERAGRPTLRADVTHVAYGAPPGLGSTPFLEIDEAPAAKADPLWRSQDDFTPPAGYIDLQSSYTSSGPGTRRLQQTGLLRKNGFYVRITCSNRDTLLTAARALRPAPVH